MSKQRVAVIGLGEFGMALSRELTRLHCEVLAVDRHPGNVEKLRDEVAKAASADVRSKEALNELFNTRFDAVVIAMGNSLEATIMCVLHLQELEVPRLLVEVSTPEAEEVMKRIGVEEIFSPERDSGTRMAHRILNPDLVDFLPLTPGHSVVEMEAPEWMHGQTLDALDLRRKRRVAVIAIHSGEKEISVVPRPDEEIHPGDRLTLVGRNEDLDELHEGKRGEGGREDRDEEEREG